MPNKFTDRSITSLAELIDLVGQDYDTLETEWSKEPQAPFPGVWYRGLSSHSQPLLPTLHRDTIPVRDESVIMNRFKQNAYEFLEERPEGEWEWMFLARHHGLPSRLLDWSENCLVALFFAAGGFEQNGPNSADGVIWCLLPTKLNGIASNSTIRTDVVPMFADHPDLSSEDEFLNNYKTSVMSHFIGTPSIPPAAGISIRTTRRIRAQQGVFTVHHAESRPINKWGDGTHVWRFVIPNEAKMKLLLELRQTGLTLLTLFPELDNVAKEAKRGY